MVWSNYPNFRRDEFECHQSGLCEMRPEFMSMIQSIRTKFGKPMLISSGYRDVSHSIEVNKDYRGEHTLGLCADVLVYGRQALELIDVALSSGITRLGVSQAGPIERRFLHLGIGDAFHMHLPKGVWSY